MQCHNLPGKIWCLEIDKITELDRMEFETNKLGLLTYFNSDGEVTTKEKAEKELGFKINTIEKRVYKNVK